MSDFTVAGKSVQDPHVNSALKKIFSDPRLKGLHDGDRNLTGTELYGILQAHKDGKSQLNATERQSLAQMFRRRFPRLKHLHSKIWMDPKLEALSPKPAPSKKLAAIVWKEVLSGGLAGLSQKKAHSAQPDPTGTILRKGLSDSFDVSVPNGKIELGNGFVLQKNKYESKPGVYFYCIRHKDFRYNLAYLYTKGGKVTEIGTSYGKATTNVATSGSSHLVVKKIRSLLGITATPTASDKVYHGRQLQHERKAVAFETKAQRLKSRLSKTPGPKVKRQSRHPFSPRDSKLVLQREVAAGSFPKKSWLLSVGARPCVIVTLWDPVSKRGYLAHVDALTLKGSIRATIGKFASGIKDPRKIQVRMFAGRGDSKTVHAIYQSLKAKGLSGNIVEADLGNGTDGVALDLKTGGVYKIDGSALSGFPNVSEKLGLFAITGVMKGPLKVVRDQRPASAVQKPAMKRAPTLAPAPAQR